MGNTQDKQEIQVKKKIKKKVKRNRRIRRDECTSWSGSDAACTKLKTLIKNGIGWWSVVFEGEKAGKQNQIVKERYDHQSVKEGGKIKMHTMWCGGTKHFILN